MKKFLVSTIFLLTFCSFAISQGLFNKGALIVIQSGALVKVDGDASGNFVNSTNITDGRIDLNGRMQIDGNWTNNATLGGHVFVNIGTNGTVDLVGTTQQWIGGSTFTDFENLTLNNAAGAQMMVDVNRVNGALTLTNGALRLNSFTLIQNNTSAASVTRTNGYIVSETEAGKLQWNIGATLGTYTYPFGVPAAYIPFVANITAATGSSMTVSTWHTGTNNVPYATGVTNMNDLTGDISVPHVADRFWLPLYTGYTANFRFTYDDFSGTDDIGLLNELNLLAQYWDGTEWVIPLVGTNNFAGDNVNSVPGRSGPWVLVDQNVPLPVKLLSFDAVCRNSKVLSTWTTATETNNDYFTLESSMDAVNWTTVSQVDGSGNSNTEIHYQYVDEKPYGGLSYYRLKQTDFDGKYEIFSPVSVVCSDASTNDVHVYPNPFKEELIVAYSGLEEGSANLRVYDMIGNIVFADVIDIIPGSNNTILDLSNIASGVYYIGFISGSTNYHTRVVKN